MDSDGIGNILFGHKVSFGKYFLEHFSGEMFQNFFRFKVQVKRISYRFVGN